MKIVIPEGLKGKELFKFLIENKSALIAQKKSIMKRAEPAVWMPVTIIPMEQANKADGSAAPPADTGVLRVKVVANTALWMDSQRDVLLPDNAKKSIKERKGMIPHLHDHQWTIDAEVGDVVNIYYQDIPLKELGIKKQGTAQCLVFETDIRKSYNEVVYNKYKAGKIKQHSIGLMYVSLELAINDSEYEKEIDFWNKYIDQIINRDEAEEAGYFWVVAEIKLMENSAVLFGSNFLTPTLETGDETGKSTQAEPPTGTQSEPPKMQEAVGAKGVNWDKIANHLSL
jgi:hypothetical protein